MAYIKIMLDRSLMDGHEVTFNAPCDCTAIDGLKVCYIENNSLQTKTFAMKDAHGNALEGIGNLFKKGAYVKAILDSKNLFAYLQNADTNAYLEEKFNNKAPAGYGYGGSAIRLGGAVILKSDAELEEALESIYTNVANGETKLIRFVGYPDNSDYSWFGILSKSSANYGSFMVNSSYVRGCIATKTKFAGTWQPIEWVNPPMNLGVEYRTTERWNGKVVYSKCVSLGRMPKSSITSVDLGVAGQTYKIVDSHFVVEHDDGLSVYTNISDTLNISLIGNYKGNIAADIVTSGDYSNCTGFITIKYVER